MALPLVALVFVVPVLEEESVSLVWEALQRRKTRKEKKKKKKKKTC